MGMKPKIAKPPPIDRSLIEMEAESKRKLEAEKTKSLRIARTGRAGTILTSGMGIEEGEEGTDEGGKGFEGRIDSLHLRRSWTPRRRPGSTPGSATPTGSGWR
mgnify:CR=1 FL=1